MAEKQVYLHLTGPFGLDRRDSAIAKPSPGILYELENFLINNGNLEVREGLIRQYASSLSKNAGNTGFKVLSLFRYYGLTALEEELKEFYAATDGDDTTGAIPSLKKYNPLATPNPTWDTLALPPGITLTKQSTTGSRAPSLGNFEQFKDRVYYTNHTEPVLMIKKEDTQVYEAGIPEANAYLTIDDCESNDGWASYSETGTDTWTAGNTDYNNFYLDAGFDRHTEGDYGITMEEFNAGKTYKLVKTLTTALDLEWFYKIPVGGTQRVDVTDTNGLHLTDTGASFTNAMLGSWIKNTTDGSTAIITQIVSATEVITTPLSGGSDNQWASGDYYTIGSYSTVYDYIAFDIFRFTKIDIDNYNFEASSCLPNSEGDFAYGHRVVIYADLDMEYYDLHQRTMLADWANNPYSNILFMGRFRKNWFVPIDSKVGSGSAGNTLIDPDANFPAIASGQPGSVIGKTIVNVRTGEDATVTARVSATQLTTSGTTWVYNASPSYYYRILDTWDNIAYVKMSLTNNAQTSGDGKARICFDNIRLLKTPPMPSELKIQVATCDAIELWTSGTGTVPTIGELVKDDYSRATEGVSCKEILNGIWVQYDWSGVRDFSQYGPDSPVTGADTLVFDIAGQRGGLLASLCALMRFYDEDDNIAQVKFDNVDDWGNPQQRHVYMQEFTYILAGTDDDGDPGNDFKWDRVVKFAFKNTGTIGGLAGGTLYIDNIRIQPPTASKMINKFMPLDLIIFDAISRGIESYFGENGVVDTIVDWLFHAYADFTRQVVGQGHVVFPEYQHGRYQITDTVALASLQMRVDAGGSLSITFIQNNDLTEYKDFNFNLDAFWGSKKKNPDDEDQWWGVDWVEIPASDSDKFTCWMSSPNWGAVAHVVFRFYVNADATWIPAESYVHTKGLNMVDDSKVLYCADAAVDFPLTLAGKRIRNDTTGAIGIINWVYPNLIGGKRKKLFTKEMEWNDGDFFTIDGWDPADPGVEKGFKFNFKTGSLDGAAGRPVPDKDNYYEYVLDVHTINNAMGNKGFKKALRSANKNPATNEENIVALREIMDDYGVQMIYKESDGDKKWSKALVSFKRGDCTPHFSGETPWAGWQCIAAHEIIVRASSKKDCVVNFQDLMITKEGGVTGTQLRYKVKMEDELGYLGPASDASYPVTVKGSDVRLADIYVPYDTRIKRKRLYRTDALGVFRYLDTIDRLETYYTDQLPEELLGPAIEEDVYRPPKCAYMRKIDNRMAYIDCFDRRGTRRSSRIHISLPFIPHQCRDADCFDVMPEDGQRTIWCEWYYGHLLVWKERSFYTIDPNTFEKSPRDLSIGCIAPKSVAAIPDGGFAWLSHEGVIFGDHTTIDKSTGEQIWPDIQNYTPQQLSHAVGWYHDRYYFIFLGYDSGVYNTRGYACYLPEKKWFYLSNWNVQCVSLWNGGTDSHEIYTGSNFGYVNQLFKGETDLADTNASTASQIASALRTLDYDLNSPHSDKYLNWVIFHAKNLSTDPSRKAMLTVTPYYDQLPTKALDDEQIMHSNYKKYDLCQDPGYESDNLNPTLIGCRINGIRRYAIKGITLDITDLGFRPFQEAGQY